MSQPSGAERMFASMLDYLRTPTWDGSRRTLLDHPELTNEAGYALLSIIASDPETVARVYPHIGRVEREALIRQHHGLLGRCRQVGVHRAFEELADEATMMRKWEAIISAGTADAAEAALAAFRAIGQPEEARPRQAHDRRHPDTQTAHSRLRRRLMAIGVAACAIAIMSTIAVVLSRDGDVGSLHPARSEVTRPSRERWRLRPRFRRRPRTVTRRPSDQTQLRPRLLLACRRTRRQAYAHLACRPT